MTNSTYNIRRSQLVSPWGVGAIVPFPKDESLMIAGLDRWDYRESSDEFLIKDERLSKRLGGRELKRPPDFRDRNTDPNHAGLTIPAVRFPRQQYCPKCGSVFNAALDGSYFSETNSNRCDKCKIALIPERFIVVCPEGHIDDFPTMQWVHSNPSDSKIITEKCKLRRQTSGASASLGSIHFVCVCGAKRSLAGIMNEGALISAGYRCKGAKPWLGNSGDESHPCNNQDLKVVQRGGTNVWFPSIVSSLYIPLAVLNADRKVIEVAKDNFDFISGSLDDGKPSEIVTRYIADANKVDFSQLFNILCEMLEGASEVEEVADTEDNYRATEYSRLIVTGGSDSDDFNCLNSTSSDYNPVIQTFIKSVSLIPKLKEVRALVGFSRLVPDNTRSLEEQIETLQIRDQRWLPAIENYGEGVFFEFNNSVLDEWEKNQTVRKRINDINQAYNSSFLGKQTGNIVLNPSFVALHTFAHLLIAQLSYECGYGSSALRERIFCTKEISDIKMNGVLIYTASGDSEGSMGGLVRRGKPGLIEDTIIAAYRNALWRSSDPICIESAGRGPESFNLAACHNCALLPETCCEHSNKFLDRGLVVGTLEDKSAGFLFPFLGE